MSLAYVIACDYPLPETEMEIEYKSELGFSIYGDYYACCHDVSDFVVKKFRYDFSIDTRKQYLEDLRKYLITNMNNNTDVELWSIMLGGDYTKQYEYTIRIPIKNVPLNELDAVEDSINYYTEHFFTPQLKYTSVMTLNEDDIGFILNNTGVCLIIKKELGCEYAKNA